MVDPEPVQQFAVRISGTFFYQVGEVARRKVADPCDLVAGNRFVEIPLDVENGRCETVLESAASERKWTKLKV